MRAVNLVPKDARRGGVSPSLSRLGVAHLLIGLLAIVLVFVTLDVLESNTISSKKAELASLQQQQTELQAQIARLNTYAQFEKLAQEREATVREIAATRFDWHGALSDLSKVVPANTSLQALSATVAPGSAASGSGVTNSPVRGDINAPAFELKGCTASQDDVARLMSQLRLINGVTRVTLEDSVKASTGSGSGTAVSGSSSGSGGCPASGPAFDLVVFFQPLSSGTATVGSTTGGTP